MQFSLVGPCDGAGTGHPGMAAQDVIARGQNRVLNITGTGSLGDQFKVRHQPGIEGESGSE
jgi:hypothetical protein